MKNAKRESLMKKIAVAALMLGIYSPLANAALSPKEGMSAQEFNDVVKDLKVLKDGRTLKFSGIVPKRCAESAIPPRYDYQNNRHIIVISMPACESADSLKWRADDEAEDLADYLSDVQLKDLDGPIMLQYYKEASKNDPDRIQADPLDGPDGKPLEHTSQATEEVIRLKQEQAEQAEAQRQADAAAEHERLERLSDLQVKVTSYCKQGDYAGVGEEIIAAADVLGDVNSVLDKVAESQKKHLEDAVKKADSVDNAQAAYEAYLNAAAINGWDQDALQGAYIDKRFDLLDTLAQDADADEVKAEKVDRSIRDWVKDLRSLDKSEYRKREGTFAKLYADLGTHAANKGKMEQAVAYYDKAKPYADAKGKVAMDKEANKVYRKQFESCIKSNPANMAACDKYQDLAKARAQNIADFVAQNGSEQEQAAFKAEYIQTFGGGMSANLPSIGNFSQVPGSFGTMKQEAYRNYMAQQQQMMMMKQMGLQPAATATAASNYLGLH
jgi:hypothetical protein